MSEPSTGRSLACESCGHALTLAQLGPGASCPFCGHRQREPGLLEELRAYHDTAAARLGAAERDRERAADWTEMARESGSRRSGVDLAVMIGLPLAFSFVAASLFKLGVLSGRAQGTFTSVAGNVAIVICLVWALRRRSRRDASRPALDAQIVACPNCGARGRLAVGEEAATCAYCGAALVPSREAMARELEVAARAERRADMERCRAERAACVKALGNSSSLTTSGAFVMMGLLGMLILVTDGWVTATVISGETPFSPGAMFFSWGIGISLVAGAVMLARHRLARRADWQAAVAALARQFGGEVLPSLGDRVAWLDRYWPEPVQYVFQSFPDSAAAVKAAGFRAMLLFDPFPFAQGYPLRIEIFVAATAPPGSGAGASGPPPPDQRVAQALAARGFTLGVTQSGYLARADDATIKALRRAPAGARQLATVVTALGQAAAAAGAVPAPPIP